MEQDIAIGELNGVYSVLLSSRALSLLRWALECDMVGCCEAWEEGVLCALREKDLG